MVATAIALSRTLIGAETRLARGLTYKETKHKIVMPLAKAASVEGVDLEFPE